ncbi:dipeptide ABC transporter ATP-binding protein [Nakamurella lactea]|uniref:dipeptide ABC transporter ATP-binding protein n=1 Tax=Nakamurella lactea TaxID=459515 RepID=UPI0003FF0A11|nr:ABC transporter ATP-binding protein [Nakamurella lactea]
MNTPEPATTPALRVQDLTVRFGSTEAVRGVSFDLAAGSRTGLVGESGSGKSVTALSVMRLVQGATTTGQVRLGDVDVLALNRRRLQKIRGSRVAMIYQDPMSSLNPVHTIGAQITEAITLHSTVSRRDARDRAVELLSEVGVARAQERLDAYPHQFSGGMRQRVMIAMALAGDPKVLIADEPTTALDVTIQARIIDLLDRIVAERHTAVLLITHDLGVAAGFCDRIHVMQHGLIVESAEAEELYARPQHPYTRSLLGAVVDLQTDVTRPIPTTADIAPVRTSPIEVDERPTAAEPTEPDTGRPPAGATVPGIPQPGAPELLRVTGIRKTFELGHSEVRAVDDVSFAVRRGQTFGLVGESGSGKSTVSSCILGLTPIDAGRVEFDGTTVNGLGRTELRELRRRMQIVFQDPFAALNRRHTVRRLVAAPLAAHGIGDRRERADRAVEMLELVGLGTQYHDRLPRELSGGQCQRVAIARALVLEPEFLVLDEAVSALDVSLQAQVLNLLRELQQRLDLTYLFVSHDLGVVRYMCSEIAVMQSGAIVEQAGRDELFAEPKQEYTRALLAAVPTADPVTEKARRARSTAAVSA